ncbi:MAG: hypothetical protein ACI87T_001935 [Planctomycetota bacterium]
MGLSGALIIEAHNDLWLGDPTLGTKSSATSMALKAGGTALIRVEQEIAFGGDLTLEAGRDILLFADIHAGGALLLSANAAVAGAPAITNGSIRITDGRSISAGGALTLRTGATGRLDGSAMLTSDVLRLSAGGNLTASAMTLSGALSAESYGTANLSKNMMISGDVDVITHGGALVFASLKGAVSGAVTLNARGGGAVAGDVTMQVGGALNLAGLDAHNANVLATGGILGDGVMSVSGVSTFQANGFAVALTNVGNSFGGEVRAISLSPSGTAIGDVDINASGNLVIGQLVGDAARLRAGGAISQTGDVTVAGDADIAAVGNIALTRTTNRFGGALSLLGQHASIASEGALTLGASTLASLTVTGDGPLRQSGALDIAGNAAFSTTGGAVALDAGGNQFNGQVSVQTGAHGATAADVSLAAAGPMLLGAIKAHGLRVVSAGALTQNAGLSATGDVVIISDGLLNLNKANRIFGKLNATSQGSQITIASFDTRIDGAMTLNARDGALVGDVQVQIGGVATLGTLDAGHAQIFATDGIFAPDTLSIAGTATLQTRSADISLTGVSNSFGGEVRLLALAAPANPGDVTIMSAGDLTISQLTARTATVSVDGDLMQSGAVSTQAASGFTATGDLFLANEGNILVGATAFSGLDVRVAVAGDLTLGDTTAQTLTLTLPGRLDQESAVSVAGLLSLTVGDSVSLGRADNGLAEVSGIVSGPTTKLRDADGFAVVGLSAIQLLIGTEADRQAGNITLGGNFGANAEVYTLGDVTIDPGIGGQFGDTAVLDAGGSVQATAGLVVGDAAMIKAGQDVMLASLNGGGATIVGRDVIVDTVGLSGALIIEAHNDLWLGDPTLGTKSSATSMALKAGGTALIRAFDSVGAFSVVAGAGIDLTAISTGGDAIADTAVGDLRLAGVDVGGDFGAHTGDGAIVARSVAGQKAPALLVAGAARFDASGPVLLPAAEGAAGHVFGGPVAITRASQVAIEASGDLTFGAVDIAFTSLEALAQGGIFDRTGNRIAGGVHLKSSGKIRGLGSAFLKADGDLRVDAHGAASLLGANDVGGAVSVAATSLDWAELGSILLADVAVDGGARLMSGMDGAFGDAAIRQGEVATVPRLTMVDGVAQVGDETFSGTLNIRGDLDLSSGLAPEIALADVAGGGGPFGEVDRGVDLGDRDNVFNGSVALRRIAGAATVTEESSSDTLHQDELDGGKLHLRQIEVIGDIVITTSDDVIFDGRMTALVDSDVPAAKPTIPSGLDDDDPKRQGLEGLVAEDFRLWLSDGATMTVDTTAAGADPSGGMIRFDRTIDGFNEFLPARTLEGVNQRAGAAKIGLNAGGGDVRFRDYVGAGAPLGDVTISSADDVAIGHTYAARAPDAESPQARYLLGKSYESDVFFASDLKIDATGDVVLYAPPGLRDSFETADAFFGVNLRGFTYGLSLRPSRVEAFGFIGGSSRQAAGLYPVGPRAPQYNLNGCVIGDVADCTGVSAPNVLTVLRLDRAQILNVEREDLFELFVSYGNEELWGVPQSYVLDLQDLGLDDEDEEFQEDEAQVSPLKGTNE